MGINYVISDRGSRHRKIDIKAVKGPTELHVATWGRLSKLKTGEVCADVRFERNAAAIATLIKGGWEVTLEGKKVEAATWAGEAAPSHAVECNVYIPDRTGNDPDGTVIKPLFDPETGEVTISSYQKDRARLRQFDVNPVTGALKLVG